MPVPKVPLRTYKPVPLEPFDVLDVVPMRRHRNLRLFVVWSAFVVAMVVAAAVVTSHRSSNHSDDAKTMTALVEGGEGFTVVEAGSFWNFLDDGSHQGVAWHRPHFDDRTWHNGQAPLGYSTDIVKSFQPKTRVGFGGDEGTKFITTYYRHQFNLHDQSCVLHGTMNVKRADGIVCYLNGHRVLRSNLPPGTLAYDTLAMKANDGGHQWHGNRVSAAAFLTGPNVIACEVHLASVDATDSLFDLTLAATTKAGCSTPTQESLQFDAVVDGDEWRYLTTDVNVGPGWLRYDWADSEWKAGRAVLGYSSSSTDIDTTIADPAHHNPTTYFRRRFESVKPACVDNVRLSVQARDGVVCYLNGIEVYRVNKVDGQTYATCTDDIVDGWYHTVVNPSNMEGPENVLSCEVSVCGSDSTTLRFDARLQITASQSCRMPTNLKIRRLLIAQESSWRYYTPSEDEDPPTQWRSSGFNDDAWSAGKAVLGYSPLLNGITTLLLKGRATTHCFRRSFVVTRPECLLGVTLDVQRADGILCFLNGAQVLRSNMPQGYITSKTLALSTSPSHGRHWHRYAIQPSALTSGKNNLACEMHSAAVFTDEVRFDARLTVEEEASCAIGGSMPQPPPDQDPLPLDPIVIAPPQVKHYQPHPIAAATNPNRGLWVWSEYKPRASSNMPLTVGYIKRHVTDKGFTLMLRMYYLYLHMVDEQLPKSVLDIMEADLIAAQAAGIKLIVRIGYADSTTAETGNMQDAPLTVAVAHIKQIGSVWSKWAPIISSVQCGVIGAYGEMHESTQCLDNPESIGAILKAYFNALPLGMQVAVRTPKMKLMVKGQLLDQEYRRVAHYDDCFLGSETDMGTFGQTGVVCKGSGTSFDSPAGPNFEPPYVCRCKWEYSKMRVMPQKQWLANEMALVPPLWSGGETCATSEYSHCPNALAQLARFRYSHLNSLFKIDVLRQWEKEGCFDNIRDALGYQPRLLTTFLPLRVRSMHRLLFNATLVNDGFATTMEAFDLHLALYNQHTSTFWSTPLGASTLDWQPGVVQTLAVSVGVPSTLPIGRYAVGIRIADPAPSLRRRHEYAMRLLNEEVPFKPTPFGALNVIGGLWIDRGVDCQGHEVPPSPVLQAETITSSKRMLVGSNALWSYQPSGLDLGTKWRLSSATKGVPWLHDNGPFKFAVGRGWAKQDDGSEPKLALTTYFKSTFSFEATADCLTSATLSVSRSDGVVCFVNGVDVLRSNVPAGELSHDARAKDSAESLSLSHHVPISAFNVGENVLACELHQSQPGKLSAVFSAVLSAIRKPCVYCGDNICSDNETPQGCPKDCAILRFPNTCDHRQPVEFTS